METNRVIQFGKVYLDDITKIYYIPIKYHPNGVEGTSIKNSVYEVVKLHEPDKTCYGAKTTVEEGWTLIDGWNNSRKVV